MGAKECDITATERKKVKKITDWAAPILAASAAPAAAATPKVECIAKISQERKKNAAAASLTLQHEGVLRLPMKKEVRIWID